MGLFSGWEQHLTTGALNKATKRNADWTMNDSGKDVLSASVNGFYADKYLEVFREAARNAGLNGNEITATWASNPLTDAGRSLEQRNVPIEVPISFITDEKSRFTAELAKLNGKLTHIREQAYSGINKNPANALAVIYGRELDEAPAGHQR